MAVRRKNFLELFGDLANEQLELDLDYRDTGGVGTAEVVDTPEPPPKPTGPNKPPITPDPPITPPIDLPPARPTGPLTRVDTDTDGKKVIRDINPGPLADEPGGAGPGVPGGPTEVAKLLVDKSAVDNVGVLAGEADVDVSLDSKQTDRDPTTGRRRPARAAFMSRGGTSAGLRV